MQVFLIIMNRETNPDPFCPRSFYVATDRGVIEHHECPSGLYYNPWRQICDWSDTIYEDAKTDGITPDWLKCILGTYGSMGLGAIGGGGLGFAVGTPFGGPTKGGLIGFAAGWIIGSSFGAAVGIATFCL
jgi:hypothetical protein